MFQLSRRLPTSHVETFRKFSSSLPKIPVLKQTTGQHKSSFQGQPHPLYSHTSLRDDVWMIEEKYFISWNRANIFFIKGSNADLLVDTGKGSFINDVTLIGPIILYFTKCLKQTYVLVFPRITHFPIFFLSYYLLILTPSWRPCPIRRVSCRLGLCRPSPLLCHWLRVIADDIQVSVLVMCKVVLQNCVAEYI